MAVRLGIVGVGGIARHHLGNLKQQDVSYAGFCDIVPERAESAAREFGGIATDDFRRLYDESPDGVLICTPPKERGELEFEACRRGIHLFVEKPVTLDLGLAREIAAAIDEAGIASVVGYKYRWDGFVRRAKEALAERAIGLVVGWFWSTPVPGPWWRYLQLSGGQMVEQATHIVDMARYLVGEIVEVSGLTHACGVYDPASDMPDAYSLQARFANGAVGSFSSSWMTHQGVGSGLRVHAHELGMHVEAPRACWADPEGEHTAEGGVDGYQGELAAFLAAIGGDRSDIASDYRDSTKTLAVTLASMRSAAEGGRPIDPHA